MLKNMLTTHSIDKKKSFSQHAKNFFNTYPKRGGLDCKNKVKELVLSKLNDLKAKLKYILVSYEIGKKEKSVKYEEIRDKEKDCKKYEHYHVLVKFDRKVRIRDAHFWDLDGVHGHYKLLDKKKNSFKNLKSYCKKDGDYLEEIDRKPETEPGIVKPNSKSALAAHLIQEIGKINPKNETDFRKTLNLAVASLDLDSRSIYLISKDRLAKAVKGAFNWNIESVMVNNYSKCMFNIPKKIVDWIENEIHKKTLILHGRSGTGKTSLAKAIFKNPLIISDIGSFAELNDDHDGLIIDDFYFEKLFYTQKLHLLDVETERIIQVKYGHVIMAAGLPRIVTTNLRLEEYLGYKNEEAIPVTLRRRIVAVEVVDDLRKGENKEN